MEWFCKAKKMNIKRLSTKQAGFDAQLDQLLAFEATADEKLEATVAGILADVRKRGDAAVLEYTRKFDRLPLENAAAMELPRAELRMAFDGLPAGQRSALEQAAQRVTGYHRKQVQASWSYTDDDGTLLGQQVTPLDRAGLYVPGGKAAYPSSVLMNALPAKVAGVGELIMVVPTPDGVKNQLVLAAAYLAGVDRVFTIGGAQAVAALAYGTATIPKVDKIVGPGNAYVASAKRRVFGVVGIDMIAGPSEILVICDGQTDPDWIAMDLFSQAEHDELAQAILLSPDAGFIAAVAQSADRLLEQMPRRDIIKSALENRGALLLAAGRVRFPETQQSDPGLRARRAKARRHCFGIGVRRRLAGARTIGFVQKNHCILNYRALHKVIRAFRNQSILGDTYGYWGSYSF